MSSNAQWASKAEKKVLKPLMEKRRRDRMNRSLERLRILLLEVTRDERLKNPKVEKAEILQTTVHFLRSHPPAEPARPTETLLQRYHSGYRECVEQAMQFLRASPSLCLGKKAYLMERISHCITAQPQWEMPVGPFPDSPHGRTAAPPRHYPHEALAGCSHAACVLHPAPALPAGHRLHPPPARQENGDKDSQDKSQNSAGQSQALNVWRPWP